MSEPARAYARTRLTHLDALGQLAEAPIRRDEPMP